VSKELDLVKHLDQVNAVATEYLKGLDASQISKELDIPRTRVMALLNDWREMAASNQAIHARAREALAGADKHYSELIKKAYEVIESADQTSNLSAKTTAIKLITDIEAKRLDMLHRAGLLDNKEIADEMAAMERKHEILVGILKDVAINYPSVRNEILKRLSEINDSPNEVIVIDS
jgi:hypothetical protein